MRSRWGEVFRGNGVVADVAADFVENNIRSFPPLQRASVSAFTVRKLRQVSRERRYLPQTPMDGLMVRCVRCPTEPFVGWRACSIASRMGPDGHVSCSRPEWPIWRRDRPYRLTPSNIVA
eukprot:5954767-Alexandrium_andersonii.AAC.1